MKTLIAAVLATTALTGAAAAQDITQFNIGILGGENAQDRLKVLPKTVAWLEALI